MVKLVVYLMVFHLAWRDVMPPGLKPVGVAGVEGVEGIVGTLGEPVPFTDATSVGDATGVSATEGAGPAAGSDS